VIKIIVNGRVWWLVAGALYSTLKAAIEARDGAK